MHRIDGPRAAPGGLFTEGDPAVGTQSTICTGAWLNAVQEEIAGVIEEAAITLSKPSNGQLLLAVRALLRAVCPPGKLAFFAGSTAPPGWVERDGHALSRVGYADLFAVIGTTCGAGDGATTFNVPDDRGNTERGWDHGCGLDAGRAFGSEQLDAVQNIVGALGARHGGVDFMPSGAFAQTGRRWHTWRGHFRHGRKLDFRRFPRGTHRVRNAHAQPRLLE